jgi:hypothetical protein
MNIPKTVALDSSQWINLIRDANGSDLQLRTAARKFAESLLEKGYSIIFSFHHLQELLAYENPSKVSERLRFIQDIEFLSWVGSQRQEYGLGSILDIIAAEARVAFESGGDAAQIRRGAKTRLIRSGRGSDIVDEDPIYQEILSNWAQSRNDRSKESEAISGFKFLDPATTVGQLKASRLSTSDEVAAKMVSHFQSLSKDISERGDRLIIDPKGIAADHIHKVIKYRQTQPNTVSDLIDKGFLDQGIDLDEIHDHRSVIDLLDLGQFRSSLRFAIEGTGLPFNDLKRNISRRQLPHFLIKSVLKPIQDTQSERSGSNSVDRELACLAPYVDVLYVDKRTSEFLRQARNQTPSLSDIIGDVRKVISWRCILSEL